MSYFLDFHPKAFKEWKHLNQSIKLQFHKKLKQRLENPRVPKDKLSGYENMYKIKLRNIGYRLAYEVQDEEIVVYVVSVGKRVDKKAHKKKAVIMPYEEKQKVRKFGQLEGKIKIKDDFDDELEEINEMFYGSKI